MKLRTGNGGIEGCAMAVDSGTEDYRHLLSPEARPELERLNAECAADRAAYLAKYPENGNHKTRRVAGHQGSGRRES